LKIFIIIVALVWQMIEEFQPPSWINDDIGED
jgi:hypothetical protein